jgi:hypothetical protein
VLTPREERIREALRSLKLQIFDLEGSLGRDAGQERLIKIAQDMILSASVVHQLVSLPTLARFDREVMPKAAGKSN